MITTTTAPPNNIDYGSVTPLSTNNILWWSVLLVEEKTTDLPEVTDKL